MVQSMLDNSKRSGSGPNPNRGGEDGFTPLMTACEAGHARVVAVLAAHPRCQLNLKNSYGQTALSFAAQNGRFETISVLLTAGGSRLNLGLCTGGRRADVIADANGHAGSAQLIRDALAAKAGGFNDGNAKLQQLASPPSLLQCDGDAVVIATGYTETTLAQTEAFEIRGVKTRQTVRSRRGRTCNCGCGTKRGGSRKSQRQKVDHRVGGRGRDRGGQRSALWLSC